MEHGNMDRQPSKTGGDGRDATGRFAAGNRIAKGNPGAAKMAKLRAKLLECVSEEDFAAVVKAVVDAARAGESWACKEFFDRLLGRPLQAADVFVTTDTTATGSFGHTLSPEGQRELDWLRGLVEGREDGECPDPQGGQNLHSPRAETGGPAARISPQYKNICVST